MLNVPGTTVLRHGRTPNFIRRQDSRRPTPMAASQIWVQLGAGSVLCGQESAAGALTALDVSPGRTVTRTSTRSIAT